MEVIMDSSDDRTKHFNAIGGHNGLGHTQNPARIWYDNWCFRSNQEVAYYQALVIRRKIKNGTFIFSPNHVFAQPGSKRREVDFLIIEAGQMLRVEIDGDAHSEELAFDRDERDRWITENLIPTKRFRSYSHDNKEWAEKCVEETFKFLEKLRTGRHIIV